MKIGVFTHGKVVGDEWLGGDFFYYWVSPVFYSEGVAVGMDGWFIPAVGDGGSGECRDGV